MRSPRSKRKKRGTFVALPALVALGLVCGGSFSEAAQGEVMVCDSFDDGVLAPVAPAKPEKAGRRATRYELLPDVKLPARVEEKIRAVADRFHAKTGKTLIVTSGTRDAEDQAEAVFDKLELGDDILKLYRSKTAVAELVRVYELGKARKLDRAASVQNLAVTIKNQMRRGVFISAHLKDGAADVRSTNMSPVEKRQFLEEALGVGGLSVMFETVPPHFHLQVQGDKR